MLEKPSIFKFYWRKIVSIKKWTPITENGHWEIFWLKCQNCILLVHWNTLDQQSFQRIYQFFGIYAKRFWILRKKFSWRLPKIRVQIVIIRVFGKFSNHVISFWIIIEDFLDSRREYCVEVVCENCNLHVQRHNLKKNLLEKIYFCYQYRTLREKKWTVGKKNQPGRRNYVLLVHINNFRFFSKTIITFQMH